MTDNNNFGFIILDGNGFSFHVLTGQSKQTLFKDKVDLPNKHGRGGQSKNRFERIREEKRGWYTSDAAELAGKYFIDSSNSMPNVTGLIVGGIADLKLDFVEKLDPRLSKIVLSIIDIQYGGEAGFSEAIEKSKSHLANFKICRQQQVLADFFSCIVRDDKSGYSSIVYGVDHTMLALEVGAVESLLVWDELPLRRLVFRSKCTTRDNRKVFYQLHDAPISASLSDYELESEESLLDYILNQYKNFGTERVELISQSTGHGSQFVLGFGGLGARLRFALDQSLIEGIEPQAGGEDVEASDSSEYEYVY